MGGFADSTQAPQDSWLRTPGVKALEPESFPQGKLRLTAALGGLVLLATLVMAAAHLAGPPCLSRLLLHVPCPGCGLTRSLVAIWHGDLALSARYHPLGIPLFAVCMALMTAGIAPERLPALSAPARRLAGMMAQRSTQRAIAFILIGQWLVRTAFTLAGSRVFLW